MASETQQRLNTEHKESTAKPGGSIQEPQTKHAAPDLSEHAKQQEKEVAHKTPRKLHKGEPVKNPKVQLPGG